MRHELFTFDLGEELNLLPPVNDISVMSNNQFYNFQMKKRFENM